MKKINEEIVTVGDELLSGSVLNTNASFLGSELTRLGFEVVRQTSCLDVPVEISRVLDESLKRSDVTVVTGGLGPTPDDLTREGISKLFKVPLIFSKKQYVHLSKLYKKFEKKVPALVKKEAFYPRGAKPLINRYGIALGFFLVRNGSYLVVLPGVPTELQKMFYGEVSQLLKKAFRGRIKKFDLTFKIIGLSEADVIKKIGKKFFDGSFKFGIYPDVGEVTIRIKANSLAASKKIRSKIQKKIREWIYASDDISFFECVGKKLARGNMTLAVAESCTGGLLSSEITKVEGASRFFKEAVVTYHRDAKIRLGIPEKLLRKYGEVSKEIALELAKNVRDRSGATYGIGITGIAGPGGATKNKPVGLVYIALSWEKNANVWKHIFWGEREQIQSRSGKKAFEYLWKEI